MKLLHIAIVTTVLLGGFAFGEDKQAVFRIEIQPVNFDRSPLPIACELPISGGDQNWIRQSKLQGIKIEALELGGEKAPEPVICQITSAAWSNSEKDYGIRIMWNTQEDIPANETRSYRVSIHKDNRSQEVLALERISSGIKCDVNQENIRLVKNGHTILQYNVKPTAQAAENEAYYSRSGYIHPLYSPSGAVITGDYAPDHKHQHGLFFAWTKTTYKGEPMEFWNQAKQLGNIRSLGDGPTIRSGVTFTQFTVMQVFEKIAAKKNVPILHEIWRVKAYNLPSDYFLFDITSSQNCVSDFPLTIEKYHYGGMAIRGNSQWLNPDKNAEPPAMMLTSEGKTRIDGNHSRPKWVVMSGLIDGKESGVAVMSHPDNFRAPQWVRLHPTKPYFVFAPMVEEAFKIEPGKSTYRSRFRYVTFDGEPDLKLLESIWKSYARPPEVKISKM